MNFDRMRLRVSELLEANRPDDKASQAVDFLLIVLIIANVIAISLYSVDWIGNDYQVFFNWFEVFSVIIFTFEYLLRLWSCVDLPPTRPGEPPVTRLKWMVSPLGLVDLLAIVPFYVYLLIPDDSMSLLMLRLIRAFQLVRLFKLTRYSPAMNVLVTVLKREAPVLAAVTFILGIIMVMAAWGIYVLERNVQPEDFGSIPSALWWAVVSLTTVGYGDVVPISSGGRMFAGLISLIGIGMISLPAGILASGFSTEIHRRNQTYQAAVEDAMTDGWLSLHEESQLEVLKDELGIDDEQARATLINARRKSRHLGRCPQCGEKL